MCPTGWRCDQCQREDSQRDHHCNDALMNERYHFFLELANAVDVWGIEIGHVHDVPVESDDGSSDEEYDPTDDNEEKQEAAEDEADDEAEYDHDVEEDEEEDQQQQQQDQQEEGGSQSGRRRGGAAATRRGKIVGNSKRRRILRTRPSAPERLQRDARAGAKARLQHVNGNVTKLTAHKVRTVKFRKVRKDQMMNLDGETVMEWKDYMGKLEARKSLQGTSESLGRKISLHGSLFIMKNPPQETRDEHEGVDC